jgi:hypothetical protein
MAEKLWNLEPKVRKFKNELTKPRTRTSLQVDFFWHSFVK